MHAPDSEQHIYGEDEVTRRQRVEINTTSPLKCWKQHVSMGWEHLCVPLCAVLSQRVRKTMSSTVRLPKTAKSSTFIVYATLAVRQIGWPLQNPSEQTHQALLGKWHRGLVSFVVDGTAVTKDYMFMTIYVNVQNRQIHENRVGQWLPTRAGMEGVVMTDGNED